MSSVHKNDIHKIVSEAYIQNYINAQKASSSVPLPYTLKVIIKSGTLNDREGQKH